MSQLSASHVQRALITSLVKLQKSKCLTDEEPQWLRGSVMRLVSEFAVLKEGEKDNESEPETWLNRDFSRALIFGDSVDFCVGFGVGR